MERYGEIELERQKKTWNESDQMVRSRERKTETRTEGKRDRDRERY